MSPQDKRPPGFYWVKTHKTNPWTVAQKWTDGSWWVIALGDNFEGEEFAEIGPRISSPDAGMEGEEE